MPPSPRASKHSFWWIIGLGVIAATLCLFLIILPMFFGGRMASSDSLSALTDTFYGRETVGAVGENERMDYAGSAKSSIAPGMPPIMDGSGASAADRIAIGPKIIKNGSLGIRVERVDAAMDKINQLTTDVKGFVADSRVTDVDTEGKTAYMTLRIPAQTFEQTVTAVKKLAMVVFDESTTANDVTAQFVDMDARLKSAKAEEAQYLEILKKAKNVEETLNVTNRLADVRSRIEQLQGQLRYMSDQTDYATLQITLSERTIVTAPTRTWQPGETLRQAFQSLIVALQQLLDVVIMAAVYLLGLVLPVLLAGYLLVVLVRWLWIGTFGRRR